MAMDFKKKVHNLKLSQLDAKIGVELSLETLQRDSRYSNTLVDLMRREETILKDNHATKAAQGIVAKVDEALKEETQAFFAKATQQNIKRWAALRNKVVKEAQAIHSQHAKNVNSTSSAKVVRGFPTIRFPRSGAAQPVPFDLEVEAERLEYEYSRNWYKYENFNLTEAFNSQSARVEKDWEQHEDSLAADYAASRAKITGVAQERVAHATGVAEDARWQHPEKQKTLIHTAPVHSPSSSLEFGRARTASGGTSGGLSRQRAADLERLDREHAAVCYSLQSQKGDAKRWLHRQQVRLVAQVEEVRKERTVIADILLEICDLNNLLQQHVQSQT